MGEIDEYNDAIKGIETIGLPLTVDQERWLQEKLDAIISEELLPAISEKIAPLLAKIKSPLTLVIDHIPGHEMALRSAQKHVEIHDTESRTYQLIPHSKPERPKPVCKTKKPEPATQLTISFPDGTVICEKNSNQTMVAALEKIGLRRVFDGGYTLVGKPIVSDHNPDWPGVFRSGNFYIYTSASNKDKIKDLKKLSKALDLGLTFETKLKPKRGK